MIHSRTQTQKHKHLILWLVIVLQRPIRLWLRVGTLVPLANVSLWSQFSELLNL